nr:MAG TPA: hypothetical protein [Caudoviricetes sp.]
MICLLFGITLKLKESLQITNPIRYTFCLTC